MFGSMFDNEFRDGRTSESWRDFFFFFDIEIGENKKTIFFFVGRVLEGFILGEKGKKEKEKKKKEKGSHLRGPASPTKTKTKKKKKKKNKEEERRKTSQVPVVENLAYLGVITLRNLIG